MHVALVNIFLLYVTSAWAASGVFKSGPYSALLLVLVCTGRFLLFLQVSGQTMHLDLPNDRHYHFAYNGSHRNHHVYDKHVY